MNLPGFTADASLNTNGNYHATKSANMGQAGVVPQLPGNMARGWRCFTDNVPGHPGARVLCCLNSITGEGWCEIMAV